MNKPRRDLFTRLKRLFSTDVVIRNVGGNQLKIANLGNIQSHQQKTNTNSIIDKFNKVYSTAPTSLYGTQQNVNFQILRPQLYSEYDVMDSDAIVASTLDIIADECTLRDDMGEIIQIKSSNEDIQNILYNLFYDVLNIEFNLWAWVRQMCKYGDFFLKLEIAEKYGVYNVIPYSPYYIDRHEDFTEDKSIETKFVYNPEGLATSSGYYTTPIKQNQNSIIFENYEIAHFRLLADSNFLPFGRSYLEPARKLFKQYTLMEDAMLIHRIVRSADKRVFFINVGTIPPNEVDTFMQRTIDKMKKVPYVDPETGDYNLRYNLQNMLEDIYIPVRGNDQSTKVDNLGGLDYDGISDVEYLRDKLFAALKVPKAFMGYAEDLEGKATLASMDIRFARTIDRLQRIILSELHKIALVHLYSLGYTDEKLINFELNLTTPSIIYDQERIMLLKEKVDLAREIIENKIMPSDWVYKNIFKFSEGEYEEYRDLMLFDARRKFRVDQIETEGNDPLETGKSYGTPHDLASLYGGARSVSDPSNIPDGYNENVPLGRPKEKVSNIGTQESPFGKDRLGIKRAKDTDKNDSNEINPRPKGGHHIALEETQRESIKHKNVLNKLKGKQSIIEKKSNLLDESQIKEE